MTEPKFSVSKAQLLTALFTHECDHCGGAEERVFTDSWTGMELCLTCLSDVAWQTTMSPASEGDNLKDLLNGISEGVQGVQK